MNPVTVLCFGTFDGLHPGHQDLFRQARQFGSRLVVVVARDETVTAVKCHQPRYAEAERLETVRRHPLVDEACLGYRQDKYQVIQDIRPDVIVLGYDQSAFIDRLEAELAKRGLAAVIHRAAAYHPETYKSSLLHAKVV